MAASSAVNLPIMSASLRLVVVCTGVRSIRWTYSGTQVPLRFTFTTNLVVFIGFFYSTPFTQDPRINLSTTPPKQRRASQLVLTPVSVRSLIPHARSNHCDIRSTRVKCGGERCGNLRLGVSGKLADLDREKQTQRDELGRRVLI